MSWETRLFCSINYNRETFNSKYDVEDRLKEVNEGIDICKNTLRNLVYMTEPNKFYNKDDYHSPLHFIEEEFNNSMETLEGLYYDKVKLEFLIDNWDNCHNEEGLGIDPPEGVKWNTAYIDGDFVRTIKRPTNEDML